MEKISSHINNNYLENLKTNNKQLATDNWNNKLLNPIGNWWMQEGIDNMLREYSDLISPDFKSWFARSFQMLNEETIRRLAGQAKEGKNPPRLFSYLINKVLKKY